MSFLRVGSQLWMQGCITLLCFITNFYFTVNKRARFIAQRLTFASAASLAFLTLRAAPLSAGIPGAGDRRGDAAPPDRRALTEQHGAETRACAQDQVTGRNVSRAAPSGAV